MRERQEKRARHEEEMEEIRSARERHFVLHETPIAKSLRGKRESSPTASTATASTEVSFEFPDEGDEAVSTATEGHSV